MEARALKPVLEDLSNRWEGDPHSASVAADSGIGPALRWYLRDFRSVRYFDTPPATATEPIVIVAAQNKQPGFNITPARSCAGAGRNRQKHSLEPHFCAG